MRNQLPTFLQLYRVIKGAGVTEKEAVNLIRCAKEIPKLRNTCQNLKNEISGLEDQKSGLLSDLYFLQNKIEELRGYLQYYQVELNKKYFERTELNKELQNLEGLSTSRFGI